MNFNYISCKNALGRNVQLNLVSGLIFSKTVGKEVLFLASDDIVVVYFEIFYVTTSSRKSLMSKNWCRQITGISDEIDLSKRMTFSFVSICIEACTLIAYKSLVFH